MKQWDAFIPNTSTKELANSSVKQRFQQTDLLTKNLQATCTFQSFTVNVSCMLG